MRKYTFRWFKFSWKGIEILNKMKKKTGLKKSHLVDNALRYYQKSNEFKKLVD